MELNFVCPIHIVKIQVTCFVDHSQFWQFCRTSWLVKLFRKRTNLGCELNSLSANITQWTPSWTRHSHIVHILTTVPAKRCQVSKYEFRNVHVHHQDQWHLSFLKMYECDSGEIEVTANVTYWTPPKEGQLNRRKARRKSWKVQNHIPPLHGG